MCPCVFLEDSIAIWLPHADEETEGPKYFSDGEEIMYSMRTKSFLTKSKILICHPLLL